VIVVPHRQKFIGFSFRSDRLCLDFSATLMFRQSEQPHELLSSPRRLTEWAVGSGVISRAARVDRDALGEAKLLREAIYRSAAAQVAGRRSSRHDVAILNRHARLPPVALGLAADGSLIRAGTADAILATIARDAVELLGGRDGSRLRRCGRDGCTRMFIDRSRGRNRNWCGMRECGNRVNAAAYRCRQRGSS
jgi:predicted RNA-binding Zn ribbon-like protein